MDHKLFEAAVRANHPGFPLNKQQPRKQGDEARYVSAGTQHMWNGYKIAAAPAAPVAAPAPSEWVSVADRLPEMDVSVLVFCPGDTDFEPRIDIEQWSRHCDEPIVDAWWDHDEDQITHWMPLPAAPDPFAGIAADFASPDMLTTKEPPCAA